MATYNVEDTVAFDITVKPAISAVVNAADGVDATLYLPGPQGPKGDVGPAGPQGPAGNTVNPIVSATNENNTPLTVKAFNGQLVDLTQWKTSDGKILSSISQDGSIFARRVDGGRKSFKNRLTANQSSIETDTAGWYISGDTNLARSTAMAYTGSASMAMTRLNAVGHAVATTGGAGVSGAHPAVEAGKVYTFAAQFRAAVTAREVTIDYAWMRSDFSQISYNYGDKTADNAAGWTQVTVTAQAPQDAAYVRIILAALNCGVNEVHHVDAISLIENSSGNLFLHHDFEDGTLGNWEKINGTETVASSLVNSTAHALHNLRSLLLTKGDSYTFAGVSSIPVIAEMTYTFSAWVRSSVAGPVRLVLRPNAGTGYISVDTTVAADTWTRVFLTRKLAPLVTSLRFDIGWEAGQAPTGATLHIDGAQMVVGSDVVDYEPTPTFNLARNPSFESGPASAADNWIKYDNLGHHTLSIVRGRTGGRAVRVTSGQAVTNSMGIYPSAYWRQHFVHDQAYVVSFYARGVFNVDTNFRIAANHGPSGGYFFLSNPLLNDGWQRYSFTMRWNAGLTIDPNGFFITVDNATGTTDPSGWVEFDDIQVELGSTPSPYFDGTSENSAWDKSEDFLTPAQSSFEDGGTTGWSGANATLANSTTGAVDGTKAMQVTPSSTTSGDSFAARNITAVQNTTYTVSGYIHVPAAQTGTLDARARRIVGYFYRADNTLITGFPAAQSAQAANAAGTTRLMATFTTPPETAYVNVRLYNGAMSGGGDVFWDAIQFEQRPFATPYKSTGGQATSTSVRILPWELGGLTNAASSLILTSASERGLVMRGAPGQTVNYLEIQDSNGNAVSRIAPDGAMSLNAVGGVFFRGHGNNDYTARVGHHLAVPGVLAVAGAEPNGTVGIGVAAPSASSVGVVVSGVASQTGDLQRWTDSAGTVLASVMSTGAFRINGSLGIAQLTSNGAELQFSRNSANYIRAITAGGHLVFTTNADNGIPQLVLGTNHSTFHAKTASMTALTVRGAASQTGHLQQWMNSAGTVLTAINAYGQVYAPSVFAGNQNFGANLSVLAGAASSVGAVIRGVASQTADLTQWQNSGGTVLTRVLPDGSVEAANLRTTQVFYQGLSKNDSRNAMSSPYGSRTWHDRLRFRIPSVVEVSAATDNTGWTTTGAPNTAHMLNVLSGTTDVGVTVSTPSLPATRITWNGTGLGYGNIQHLLLGFLYNNPSWEARVIWETSADGTAWTVRRDGSIGNPTASWKGTNVDDHGGDSYFRLTIIGYPGANTTGSLILATFQALSGRPGNQGGGFQNEFPFGWNENKTVVFQGIGSNIVPLIARGMPSQSADIQQWQTSTGTVLASIGNNGDMLLQRDGGTTAGRLNLGNINHGFGRGSGLNAGAGVNHVGLFTAGGTDSGFSFWHATTGNLLDINGSSKAAVFAGDVKAPSVTYSGTSVDSSSTAWVSTKTVAVNGTAEVVDFAQMSPDSAVVLHITTMHNNGRNSYIVHATHSTNGKGLVVASANQPYGPANATFSLDAATGKIQASIAYPVEFRAVVQNLRGTTTAL